MKKKLFLLFSLLFAILIFTSCGDNENELEPNDNNDNQELYNIPGILDESKQVSEFKVVDVPTEPIEIGSFSSTNIKLQATYLDGTKGYKTITEEFFDEEDLAKFKTPGEKKLSFLYRDNLISFKITLKEPKTKPVFKVEFRDRNESILCLKYVDYLAQAKYDGTKNLGYYSDGKYYRFDGKWNENINHIYKNTIVYPEFTECKIENHFDNYLDRNTMYGTKYDLIKTLQKGDSKESLLYVGRMQNVLISEYGEAIRDNYKNCTLEYNRISKTRTEFTEGIANTLKRSILSENYNHEFYGYNPYCSLNNSCLLNFNLSLENSYSELSISIPQCFLRSIDDSGYGTDLSFKREDNINTSFKSIFNHLYNDSYNLYYGDNSNIFNVMEDYPLGIYSYGLYADLDVYLDITYTEYKNGGVQVYQLSDAKIAMCYDNLKLSYKFKNSDDYNVYKNKLVISDRMVAEALFYIF